ncbi:MAG: PIN domain-containing protein [Thermomicrobiales bacterium]
MKVSVDTNVLISFLLNPGPSRQPFRSIQGAFERRFELLISESTIQDLLTNVERKPYLSTHIASLHQRPQNPPGSSPPGGFYCASRVTQLKCSSL